MHKGISRAEVLAMQRIIECTAVDAIGQPLFCYTGKPGDWVAFGERPWVESVARVKRLMDRLGAYERYWLYPGAQNLATFRAHLESLSTVRLTEEVSLPGRFVVLVPNSNVSGISKRLDDQERRRRTGNS